MYFASFKSLVCAQMIFDRLDPVAVRSSMLYEPLKLHSMGIAFEPLYLRQIFPRTIGPSKSRPSLDYTVVLSQSSLAIICVPYICFVIETVTQTIDDYFFRL
jgi:hypothetical protein